MTIVEILITHSPTLFPRDPWYVVISLQHYAIKHHAHTLQDALEWVKEKVKQQEDVLSRTMTNPFQIPPYPSEKFKP